MSNVLDEVIEGLEPLPQFVSVMAGSKAPVLVGLDIGTSGIRAALFDEDGSEIEGASVRINRWRAGITDFATIDPEVLLGQVADVIDALCSNLYESITRIEWIAISCFWHSLVGVDQAGRATTPVFGWADSRAAAAAYQLRAEFDEAKFHARTGCRFHPSYWPAKLLRLKTEEPDTFRATSRWLSFADYLTLNFFGETAASVSMASGTGLFDQRTCEWDAELLAALDIDVAKLADIALPDQTFHGLGTRYAARWPRLSKARLFPAIGDGAANNIGAGCHSTDKMALMIGTSGAMRVVFKGEPPAQLPPELWCYRADRNRMVVGGALSDGGGLFNWIKESLLYGEDEEFIQSVVASLKPDGHGLTVLPFWAGERSTGWTPDARGAILGLTMQTRPIEILRAAMEAIAYRFALLARALDPFAPAAKIVVSGNALRSSPTWTQMLADVLGRDLMLSELAEASTRGAALLALEAAGRIQSIEEFSASVETTFEPSMSHHAMYQDGLERHQQIYERIIKTRQTGR